VNIRPLIAATLAAPCFALSGCGGTSAATPPTASVFVLVDLSETWNNPVKRAHNEDVLREIGEGIAAQADDFDPPVSIQYRAIGVQSLERAPLCDVRYERSIVATLRRRPAYVITQPRKLESYLGVTCPMDIAARPPEALTQISAAVSSVADEAGHLPKKRAIIIASDFQEEISPDAQRAPFDLKGFSVLMIYRPVTEDQQRPVEMKSRVDQWRTQFEARGARVEVAPDTALKRDTIEAFLAGAAT
jgi:hypothetical protein